MTLMRLVASNTTTNRDEAIRQFAEDVITLNNRLLDFLKTPIPDDSTAYLYYVSALWELRRQAQAMTASTRVLQK